MAVSVGIARVAANSGERCGDAARVWLEDGRAVVAIADGLGHGADAAVAADAAMDYVGRHLGDDPMALFRGMHAAMANTRGAAVAMAVIAVDQGTLTYLAVGNTRAGVFGWRATRLDSYPGIVGGGFRRLAPVVTPIRPGDRLILWTDGVEEGLSVGPSPQCDAQAEAAQLLRQFSRGNDDACVVVARLDSA
jgi:serine phosphatase RsbU (regulator of sigma subunit)